MWRFCNDDVKFIRKGGRKAVKINKNDFISKLIQHTKDLDPSFEEGLSDVFKGPIDTNGITEEEEEYLCYSIIEVLFYEDEVIIKDNNVDFDVENAGGKFITMDNGLTCLKGWAAGDWECAVYFIIYYDGKKFRLYIPRYGNTYNLITKTAFGSEENSDKYDKFIDDIKKFCLKKKYDINVLLDKYNLSELYCLVYGDNDKLNGEDSYSDEAMDLDIAGRIVVS